MFNHSRPFCGKNILAIILKGEPTLILMKDIVRDGDPVLRQVAQKLTFPLSDHYRKLADDMMEYLVNSQDPKIAAKHQLRAGVVWANTFNRFDPASPFGGYKESGYGREGGRHGLAAYLKARGVHRPFFCGRVPDFCRRQRPGGRRGCLCRREHLGHAEDDGHPLRRRNPDYQLPPEKGVRR